MLRALPEVSLRLVVTKAAPENGTWMMQALALKVAPDTLLADWSFYDYGHIAFSAAHLPGHEIVKWLEEQKGHIAELNFEVPEVHDQVRAERLPSHARYRGFDGLWQPHSHFELSATSGRYEPARQRHPLIQDGCPSFPTLAVGAYKLLYDLDAELDHSFPGSTVSLRIAHTEAWIERIEQYSSSLVINVQGDAVEGVRLEVTGSQGIRFDQKLREPGDVRLEFPDGLPKKLWLLLSRKDRWLDLRDLNQYGSSSPWENVIDVPPDFASQVAGAIARGEGEQTEFKEQLPHGDDKFLRVVAAFANGEGGMIIIGVVDSTGQIKGLTCDLDDLGNRINQMIRARVIPEPKIKIETCEIEGRKLLVVIVEKGEERPYGVGSDPTKLLFYVRRGATTPPARQDEIRAMVIKGNNQTVLTSGRWPYVTNPY